MYWGRLVKIDTALYPISTQRNLAVASENISMLLNPGFYGSIHWQVWAYVPICLGRFRENLHLVFSKGFPFEHCGTTLLAAMFHHCTMPDTNSSFFGIVGAPQVATA
jgi:hypothetical protein